MLIPPVPGSSHSEMLAGILTQITPFREQGGIKSKQKNGALSLNHKTKRTGAVLRLLGRTFCVRRRREKNQSRRGEDRGRLSADWKPLGGERDRLKRVSNHDIPVLTPQLFKRKNRPVASEMHHRLAASREMLRQQVRGF